MLIIGGLAFGCPQCGGALGENDSVEVVVTNGIKVLAHTGCASQLRAYGVRDADTGGPGTGKALAPAEVPEVDQSSGVEFKEVKFDVMIDDEGTWIVVDDQHNASEEWYENNLDVPAASMTYEFTVMLPIPRVRRVAETKIAPDQSITLITSKVHSVR